MRVADRAFLTDMPRFWQAPLMTGRAPARASPACAYPRRGRAGSRPLRGFRDIPAWLIHWQLNRSALRRHPGQLGRADDLVTLRVALVPLRSGATGASLPGDAGAILPTSVQRRRSSSRSPAGRAQLRVSDPHRPSRADPRS